MVLLLKDIQSKIIKKLLVNLINPAQAEKGDGKMVTITKWEGKDIPVKNNVPDNVRSSKFGCVNCLWASCECKQGSMFKNEKAGFAECSNYTYYD